MFRNSIVMVLNVVEEEEEAEANEIEIKEDKK